MYNHAMPIKHQSKLSVLRYNDFFDALIIYLIVTLFLESFVFIDFKFFPIQNSWFRTGSTLVISLLLSQLLKFTVNRLIAPVNFTGTKVEYEKKYRRWYLIAVVLFSVIAPTFITLFYFLGNPLNSYLDGDLYIPAWKALAAYAISLFVYYDMRHAVNEENIIQVISHYAVIYALYIYVLYNFVMSLKLF